MSKELEALESIRKLFIGSPIDMSNEFEIIELAIKRAQHYINSYATLTRHIEVADTLISSYQKKLKALDIIKEKPWLVGEIVESKGNYDAYKSWCKMFRADMKYRATQEEYDLLKEVLK